MAEREPILAIERAALWAWPPKATAHVAGWLLRAGDGARTRRIDSAQTLAFDTGIDLAAAIGRVEAWYAARGLPACLQLTGLAQPPDLDARLADRGYARLPSVSVMLLDADRLAAAPERRRIELLARPTPSVMNAICDPSWDAATRWARAALFARIRRPHLFGLVLEGGGEPAAAGLCVVDGTLAGLFSLRTAVPFRGRGHARVLAAALIGWARAAGAGRIYLQVEDDNAPAMALWRPFGGRRVYGYWYREQGPTV
jgi:GNAT superfamily N-acetyltransferase